MEHAQKLPDQRHAVKDYFPIYIRNKAGHVMEGDSRQACAEDAPLTELDELVIANWRRRGYVIPSPELKGEVLDDLCNKLRNAAQRFEDRLSCER